MSLRDLRNLALGMAVACALPVLAAAETLATLRDGSGSVMSFSVPDFWTMNSAGPRALVLPGTEDARSVPPMIGMHPTVDPTVWMGFFRPPGVRSLTEGRAYLREIGMFLSTTPKMNPPRRTRIDGRPAEVISGTGRRNGQPVQFAITMIDLPGSRIVIAASILEAGTDQAFFDEVNRVYRSIRIAQ